jgi:hypothetical protein
MSKIKMIISLRLEENLRRAESAACYFHSRTDRYHAAEHFHDAWAVAANLLITTCHCRDPLVE